MYNLKIKEAIYKYRRNNKEKYNAYSLAKMNESYNSEKRHKKYLIEKEVKIFLNILIDSI